MIRSLRPRSPRGLVFGALILATAATAACHDAAGPDRPPPAARETRLIATASGKSAANDVLLVQAISAALGGSALGTGRSALLAIGAPGAAARTAPSADVTYGGLSCTYDQDIGRFVCPEVTLESMTIRAQFALYDAAKTPQSAYDDVTTTSATIWYWARGALVNPDGGAAIDRKRTLTVDGLQSGATERVFGGVGTDTASGPLPGNPAQTYVLHDTTTAAGVAVGVPFSANVWPLRGELRTDSRLDIVQGGSVVTTTRRRVVVTFNGTQFVGMKVGGATSTTTYTLDLGTGDLTPDP